MVVLVRVCVPPHPPRYVCTLSSLSRKRPKTDPSGTHRLWSEADPWVLKISLLCSLKNSLLHIIYFVNLVLKVQSVFSSLEPKAQGELLWSVFVRWLKVSYCDRSLSIVCWLKVSYCDRSLSSVRPSLVCRSCVNFFFKRHLLNHWSKSQITWHMPLSKLHEWIHSTEQEGCQSSR